MFFGRPLFICAFGYFLERVFPSSNWTKKNGTNSNRTRKTRGVVKNKRRGLSVLQKKAFRNKVVVRVKDEDVHAKSYGVIRYKKDRGESDTKKKTF